MVRELPGVAETRRRLCSAWIGGTGLLVDNSKVCGVDSNKKAWRFQLFELLFAGEIFLCHVWWCQTSVLYSEDPSWLFLSWEQEYENGALLPAVLG